MFIVAGCGEKLNVGQVEGTVLVNGKPGNRIRVEFVPDVGLEGPPSYGETDDQGHFELRLMQRGGDARPGAVVGQHRVTLSDLQLAESATGRDVPIRFDPDYSMPSTTPLTQQVSEGEQSVTIEVP